jgi:hypothetical protein
MEGGTGTDGATSPEGGGPNMDAETGRDGTVSPATDGEVTLPDGRVVPADAATDETCLSLGEGCTTGVDCCSGSCEPDVTGKYVCTAAAQCAGLGEKCKVAADCCSLGCDGKKCVDELCLVADSECDDDAQCCSNRCEGGSCESGGACLPVGEDCSDGGDNTCCSLSCVKASDDLMRCSGTGRCRSEGEVCTEDNDCCNYQCDQGFCLIMPECDPAGEACDHDDECCSRACRDNGTGFRSCQFIGGCRPTGELCRKDKECCNDPAYGGPGVCEMITADIGRCDNPTGCAPAGEICKPDSDHDCCPCATPQSSPGCPNPNGDVFCRDTIFGVKRCFSDDCVVEDGPCENDEDCCGDECVDGTCAPGDSCLEDLEPCAFSDQCCCLICAPDDNGDLVCCPEGTECIPVDGPCTTDADCCDGNCTRDGVCGEEVTDCVPFGGQCTTDEDCCDDIPCTDGICRVPIG